MPIGPRGEPLPYPDEAGAGQAAGPAFDPRAMNPGVGTGPAMPPQMPPIEAVVARIQELQTELEQLIALAEQIGGGPEGGVSVGGAGGMPQMPVGGDTGLPGAMPGLLA
jgi:hypothetical protein